MLTRKRISLPNYSGDARRDFEALKEAIGKYLLTLEAKQSLTLDSATGMDNTPVGAKTASTGAFTTLSASSTLTASALIDASGASAGQIKFPATQNASADANTLDDYQEWQAWTPADGSGASLVFTAVDAHYSKIGNMVLAFATLTYPSTVSGANANITGLPFTSLNAQSARGGVTIGFKTESTLATMLITANSKQIQLLTETGTAITNATMSLDSIYFMAAYPTT